MGSSSGGGEGRFFFFFFFFFGLFVVIGLLGLICKNHRFGFESFKSFFSSAFFFGLFGGRYFLKNYFCFVWNLKRRFFFWSKNVSRF